METQATSHGFDTSTNTALVKVFSVVKPNMKGQGNTAILHVKPIVT